MNQREQMELEIRKWRQSGLKKKEYCQQHGIKMSTFGYWITRINQHTGKGFIPLNPPAQSATSCIEITYPSGVRLKVSNPDFSTISRLISLR